MSKKPWEFENSLCSEIGTELFYIEDGYKEAREVNLEYKMAKKLCNGCVNLLDCADWGIKHEAFGIWGGLTPIERRQIRKWKKITLNQIY